MAYLRGPLLAVCLAAVAPFTAMGADLQITLPTITAVPGATVAVPLDLTPAPAGLGIQSIQFRMDFAPSVIESSASLPDGWLQAWGPPFVNANASFLAASAAGFPALASNGTRLNTLLLTISPSAVPGTDMPLAFSNLLLNEGSPSVAVTNGLLRVRTNLGVEPAAAGLVLGAPSPNPARATARVAITVPDGGSRPVRVAVFGVDGRLVRRLADAPFAPGRHEVAWDTRDASGQAVKAGLYFVRADCGGRAAERRLVVVR
jgi:hypothetical protein